MIVHSEKDKKNIDLEILMTYEIFNGHFQIQLQGNPKTTTYNILSKLN
jgi:hypothetical protein